MKNWTIPVSILALLLSFSLLRAQSSKTVAVRQSNGDTVEIGQLEWMHPVDRALKKAKNEGKPVLMLRVLGHLSGDI